MAGSHVHSLVLTDIATEWTEAVGMIVREQTLVIESVEDVRRRLPFGMRGLDVDNGSAFINEALVAYSRDKKLELTRCRAYKKNDQAWIEQKNGAVVRRMVGYGRLEGAAATTVLNQLFAAARFYVNYFQPSFQPSFKLLSKSRDGAKASLSTAWRDGEVRPTHRKRATGPRTWRTRTDPFEKVWPLVSASAIIPKSPFEKSPPRN